MFGIVESILLSLLAKGNFLEKVYKIYHYNDMKCS